MQYFPWIRVPPFPERRVLKGPRRFTILLEIPMLLRMESPAPPIKVESWLRGRPLTNFWPGNATISRWPKPQKQYKDRGFEVLGAAAMNELQRGIRPKAVRLRD